MTEAKSTRSRTRSNVVWSGLDFAVLPLGLIVATPIFIGRLGLEQYGVLILVNSLAGFSAVLNFGFGDTALRYVSHFTGLGEERRAAEIVRLIGFLSLGSGLVLGGLCLIGRTAISRVFNLEGLAYADRAVSMAALIMPLRMLESVYISTLKGRQRYDLAGGVTIVGKLLIVAIQVGLALMGFGVAALLSVMAAVTSVSCLALAYLCTRDLGNILPAFFPSAFAEIRQFAFWSWLQGLAAMFYVNADRLILTALLGPSALGVYGVCVQISQNIHNGISALAHALFPKISALNSQQRDASARLALRRLYLDASRTTTVAVVLLACVISVFAEQILAIWVGGEVAAKGHLALSIMVISYSWFTSNHTVVYYTLNGTGRAKGQAIVAVVCAAIMTVSTCFLVPLAGISGGAIARFPDVLVRLGVRAYVGEKLLGGIKWFLALDFLRVTLLGWGALQMGKWLIVHLLGLGFSILHPLALFTIIGVVSGTWFAAQRGEKRFAERYCRG